MSSRFDSEFPDQLLTRVVVLHWYRRLNDVSGLCWFNSSDSHPFEKIGVFFPQCFDGHVGHVVHY